MENVLFVISLFLFVGSGALISVKQGTQSKTKGLWSGASNVCFVRELKLGAVCVSCEFKCIEGRSGSVGVRKLSVVSRGLCRPSVH